MADYTGEIGSFTQIIHSREGSREIVREYRVIENANDAGMLRVEFTDGYAAPGSEFLGSRGFVPETDHRFGYADNI